MTSSPPMRPGPIHSSSSTSNSAFSHHMPSGPSISSPLLETRPSLTDARRVSSGIGGSSFGHGSYRDKEDAVPVGFDEGILRGLCDMDVSALTFPVVVKKGLKLARAMLSVQGSLPLITDRIKQSIASCKVRDCPRSAVQRGLPTDQSSK